MSELSEKEELEEAIKNFQKCPFYHWWKGSYSKLTLSNPIDDNEIRSLRSQLRDYLRWPFFALFDRIGL